MTRKDADWMLGALDDAQILARLVLDLERTGVSFE
jgi:hypothetical protein